MNKYSWDLNYLIKKRDELQKKVNIYESSLATYNALIACFDKRITGSGYAYKDELDGISNDIDVESFIEKILPNTNPAALEFLLQTKDIFMKYKLKGEKIKNSPCYLTNKQLIDYTISLIEQIPHVEFTKSIKSCVIPKRHLLHIKHKKKLSTNYYGISFVDFSQKRPYGLIARENNINDIVTLAHELFHMVIKKDLSSSNIKSSADIYDEIEGYMANFIIKDLLKQDYPPTEMDCIDAQDLWKTGWAVYDMFVTTALLNFTDDNYKISLEKVNEYLKKEKLNFKITKKNMNAFFFDTFNDDLNYGFSYLAALDLYNLYKMDPEKAINHLYSIKNFTGKNIETELKSIDCTFYEDGYQSLDKKCNQLLKKKTTKK